MSSNSNSDRKMSPYEEYREHRRLQARDLGRGQEQPAHESSAELPAATSNLTRTSLAQFDHTNRAEDSSLPALVVRRSRSSAPESRLQQQTLAADPSRRTNQLTETSLAQLDQSIRAEGRSPLALVDRYPYYPGTEPRANHRSRLLDQAFSDKSSSPNHSRDEMAPSALISEGVDKLKRASSGVFQSISAKSSQVLSRAKSFETRAKPPAFEVTRKGQEEKQQQQPETEEAAPAGQHGGPHVTFASPTRESSGGRKAVHMKADQKVTDAVPRYRPQGWARRSSSVDSVVEIGVLGHLKGLRLVNAEAVESSDEEE